MPLTPAKNLCAECVNDALAMDPPYTPKGKVITSGTFMPIANVSGIEKLYI